MEEVDVRKRFLKERKRAVQEDVAKVKQEYHAIVNYLNSLISQVEKKSNELLAETDYGSFTKKFGPSMNEIQDIQSKLILLRLSLPDHENIDNSEGSVDGKSSTSKKSHNREASDLDLHAHSRYIPPPVPSVALPLAGEDRNTVKLDLAKLTPHNSKSEVAAHKQNQTSTTRCYKTVTPKYNGCSGLSDNEPRAASQKRAASQSGSEASYKETGTISQKLVSKNMEMQDITDKLDVHHERYAPSDARYQLEEHQIHVGALVSAPFDDDCMWYRARIVAIYSGKDHLPYRVKVLYIDYGNCGDLSVVRLRSLPREFYDWPAQAFVCSLTRISPMDSTMNWSASISEKFSQMVLDRDDIYVNIDECNVTATECPLLFVDVFEAGRGIQPPLNPTVVQKLQSHGLARPTSNRSTIKWYQSICSEKVCQDDGVIDSMSWFELHSLQKARILLDDDLADRTMGYISPAPSSSCSEYVVNHAVVDAQNMTVSARKAMADRLKHSAVSEHLATLKADTDKLKYAQMSCSGNENYPNDVIGNHTKVSLAADCRKQRRSSRELETKLQTDVDGRTAGPTASFAKQRSQTEHYQSAEDEREMYSAAANCGSRSYQDNSKQNFEHLVAGGEALLQQQAEAFSRLQAELGRRLNLAVPLFRIPYAPQSTVEIVELNDEFEPVRDCERQRCQAQNQSGKTRTAGCRGETETGKKVKSEPPPLQQEEPQPVFRPVMDDGNKSQKIHRMQMHTSSSKSEASTSAPHCAPRSSADVVDKKTSSAGKAKVSRSVEAVAKSNLPGPIEQSSNSKSRERCNDVDVVTRDCVSTSKTDQNSVIEAKAGSKREAKHDVGGELKQKLPTRVLTVPGNRRFSVAMSVAESPSRFWIHILDEDVLQLDWLQSRLHDYALQLASETSLNPVVLEMYTVCCARSPIDEQLYRAEIIQICYGTGDCLSNDFNQEGFKCKCDQLLICSGDKKSFLVRAVRVLFVDYGMCVWISATSMVPLPLDVCSLPPMAICCELADVLPAVSSSEEDVWSREAVELFLELSACELKLLWADVDQCLQRGDQIAPSLRKPLRVCLTDEEGNIGTCLVNAGAAKFNDAPVLKNWNPMDEEYHSERNSHLVDMDDPGVATVGYKARDEERICKFYRMRGGCWRGDDCPYEHTRLSDMKSVTSDKREVFCCDETEMMVDLPEVGNWVIVQVTHIFSPSHVCVIFPFGSAGYGELLDYEPEEIDDDAVKLQAFLNNIHDHYCRNPLSNSDLILYGVGELVAAKCNQDNRWGRARVLGFDSANNFRVIYIDYGHIEWVPANRIRQLEREFLRYPSQAVHCRLPIRASSKNGIWDDSARDVFEELVAGKMLFAHVLNRDFDGTLHAELHDGSDDRNICKELINMQFAVATSNAWLPSVSDSMSSDRPMMIPG